MNIVKFLSSKSFFVCKYLKAKCLSLPQSGQIHTCLKCIPNVDLLQTDNKRITNIRDIIIEIKYLVR